MIPCSDDSIMLWRRGVDSLDTARESALKNVDGRYFVSVLAHHLCATG
jgi:hypothetical protein